MVMTDRHDVGTRLIDAAVNDALGVKMHLRRFHRIGIERELQNIVGLDQQRRARARQQITPRIARMTRADMAEGVKHALVGENAVGERQLRDSVLQCIGHDRSSYWGLGNADIISNIKHLYWRFGQRLPRGVDRGRTSSARSASFCAKELASRMATYCDRTHHCGLSDLTLMGFAHVGTGAEAAFSRATSASSRETLSNSRAVARRRK